MLIRGALKKVLYPLLSRCVLIPKSYRIIFCFHDISEPDATQHSALYSTRPAQFKAQIAFLRSQFEFVPLGDLMFAADRGSRLAAITFDDGFLSDKDVAMPILQAAGIPFSIFLNQTAIERNYIKYDLFNAIDRRYESKKFLDRDDVIAMDRKGVAIGSHTQNHRALSSCDDASLEREIRGNKQFLEDLLGHPVLDLALPYGKREHYDQRAITTALSAGHRFIYSTNPGLLSASRREPLELPIPRISILNEDPETLRFYINRPMFRRIEL